MFLPWNELVSNPQHFVAILIATAVSLLIAITVHEFSHALIAYRLGDSTARNLGRLSLNPLVHLDPLGTLMLFLAGFGWGKPTPVDPNQLRFPGFKGMALVSLSGPISNFLTAALFAVPIRLGIVELPSSLTMPSTGGVGEALGALLTFIVYFNLVLGVFNLIPIAPLDGFKVVLGIVPRDIAEDFARFEIYGPFVLLAIVVLDNFFNVGILSRIIGPPLLYLLRLLLT